MDDIESIQLPEGAQFEDTKSESIDCEDASTEGNGDIYFLRAEDTSVLTDDKTDEEKLVQSSDNLLSVGINSPKTTLLGKLKAKQRLQAFLLPKQSLIPNSPVKKTEDNQNLTKMDKTTKKRKKNPITKAKTLIEEIEEIKKSETAKIILSPTLFREKRSIYREKHYRHKSRSKSSEFVRKAPEKGKYPANWEEIKERQLSLENVYELKLNTQSRNIKHQGHYDFRKQLLFELPPQTISPLKVKTLNGPDKTIPPQYVRFTKKSPSVSYSISHHKYGSEYFFASEIYECIPKSHLEIITKFKTDTCIAKFTDDVPRKSARKWYPKQALSNITEGCELLQKSLGLSILQNYMDEEEEDEKNIENTKLVECSVDYNNKGSEDFTSEGNLENQSTAIINDKNRKEEINDVENEYDNSGFISKTRKKSEDKKHKNRKHKSEKRNNKDGGKRKRKKGKEERVFKKKKVKTYKDDKKISKEHKKEKNKKKEAEKEDSKVDTDQKSRKHKENKKDLPIKVSEKRESGIEIKREQEGNERNSKWPLKGSYGWKESKKSDPYKKDDKRPVKRHKDSKRERNISSMELYYDEFELLEERSLSIEKDECVKKETEQKSRDSLQELNKKSSFTRESKRASRQQLKTDFNKRRKSSKDNKSKTENFKATTRLKQETLYNIEPLKSETRLGTPDTDEYHSHWESDEDVSNVISYSPLLPRKLNTSWESDEDVACSDKHLADDRYIDQSLRKSREKSVEKRSKKYLEGERSLEMPLNIINLSRKDPRKPSKPLNVPDRKLNNESRLLFEEDSWERGEFLKICNDIEGEKLRHERKTLSEERKLLEIEKRKLAEKLERRSFKGDIFDDFETNVKEMNYKKINCEKEDVYLKSPDYVRDNRNKACKDIDEKKKSRKRNRSNRDRQKESDEDHRPHNDSDSKKFRCDKLENYKNKSPKTVFIDLTESKSTASETLTSDVCLLNEILDTKQEMMHAEHESNKRNVEKMEKHYRTSGESEIFLIPDVSDSLMSACDSLTSDTKTASKSNILENEYEEFLKAVTADVLKEDNVSTEKKTAKRKKKEIKKTKSRRRKYSTSSSSSSSDSYDSDSSSTSSTSSSYSSSASSTSSDEREAKRRKMKAKRKKLKDKQGTVKIEMTHSIVKDLDDLQPYPVSSTPTVQIKKEEEDLSYSEISAPSSFGSIEKETKVPLPVPSPSIVPPPCINLLSIKQEKTDESVSNKADSTTSPTKKVPLIPTKFIPPLPRKEIIVTTATTIVPDTPKIEEPVTSKMCPIDFVESPSQITKNSSFFFSFTNKRAILNENVNDSDSQDFTDYFKKKIEKPSNNREQISDLNTLNTTESKHTVEASRISTVENEVEEISLNKTENVAEITNPPSLTENEPSIVDIDLPPSSPRRNVSSCARSDLSPKRKIESAKCSPPKDKKKSHSESGRRSPRKSASPKYRNASPRISPQRRRRPVDVSPVHRRSSRYHNDFPKLSPRRKRSSDRYDRPKQSPSPRSRKGYSSRGRRSISPRRRSSISPRKRSLSPRRSSSPRIRKSSPPRSRKSPVNRSPTRRSSSSESRRRSYSRSVSPEHKKKSIQQTLQRLAGIDDHYHQAINKSPINSPVDGFKRSVADSTISDDQLLQQNSAESIESPYVTAIKSIQSPLSPKRVPLDVRINQVLGLGKNSPTPITTTYTQSTYAQSYTYDQYSDYEHYTQYEQGAMDRDGFVHPSPQSSKLQSQVGSSKVVQIGNMLQVVPAEDILPQELPRPQPPPQKIVQVGNMLQIVPSPTTHVPQDVTVPSSSNTKEVVRSDISLQILQSAISVSQPSLPSSGHIASTTTQEKVSPEDIMLQKIAERRAERAKRHEERERKRNEKEKRRKEKEKKKQLRFKLKTENMIKKALRIETEALAMGENLDDEENGTDVTPSCWPSINITSNTPLKQAGKGILIRHGFSALTVEEDGNRKLKCVKFADGIAPGEGTSPSGGEELSSPPPPKEKRSRKTKKKKLQKKKIKVKIIRKSTTESPDDEELDNLPPPSPPPGSPPSHIFPARIKSHTINNIHPTYATGVPLMTVSNYAPQFRANIPITVPPPPHNIPHGTHHGPSPPRPPSQIVSQHGSSLHGPISHGVSPGLTLGMPGHPHASLHHPTGLR